MAKKKSSNILSFISLVLGVGAILSLFLSCITVEGADSGFSGWQVIFGYYETAGFLSVKIFDFSLMNCIGFALIAGGTLLVLLSVVGNGSKLITLIYTLALLGGAVFMFLMPNFVFAITDSIVTAEWILDIGAIIAGSASALAGLVGVLKLFKK